MVDEKLSTTKVKRVEPNEKSLSSPLDGPYFKYLDEHDGDREIEKYNGKPCAIVKNLNQPNMAKCVQFVLLMALKPTF